MTLSEAITIRAAYCSIKRQLKEAGVDLDKVKSLTDLPSILAGLANGEVMEMGSSLMENEDALGTLMEIFGAAAKIGAVQKIMYALFPNAVQEDVENA